MAIVTNGSPLFTGNAGSGESEIRRYLLENDLLEAIIALPTEMFFNTGIQTYVWVLTRQKSAQRAGKVQVIDASKLAEKMPKSLGNKRNRMSEDHIRQVVKAHGDFAQSAISKVFGNADFGYRTVTIDRPMRHNYQASEQRLARLRFNLRPPLNFELPVIVLDGYADARYYAALFREQVVVFNTFDPGPKLDVECDARLRLDPAKDGKADGRQRRKLIAEELAKQRAVRPGSKQLVLLNKAMQKSGSEWGELVDAAFAAHPAKPTPPARMHWHAGRGRNDQEGADVYALSAPFLSPMYEKYTLAGVFPSDYAERDRLKEHAQATELLQMLNRGRQPAPKFVASKPRIVLGMSEEKAAQLLGHLADHVVLRPYTFLSRIEKKSKNVRWCEMMIPLVGELLAHFPEGVPLELIGALPKYHKKTQGQAGVVDKLKALALRAPLDSHLHRTFHDPAYWPYQDVHPGGGSKNRRLMADVIAALNLRAKGTRPEIYLPDTPGASETAAWTAYKTFVDTGATALHPPAPGTPTPPVPTLP